VGVGRIAKLFVAGAARFGRYDCPGVPLGAEASDANLLQCLTALARLLRNCCIGGNEIQLAVCTPQESSRLGVPGAIELVVGNPLLTEGAGEGFVKTVLVFYQACVQLLHNVVSGERNGCRALAWPAVLGVTKTVLHLPKTTREALLGACLGAMYTCSLPDEGEDAYRLREVARDPALASALCRCVEPEGGELPPHSSWVAHTFESMSEYGCVGDLFDSLGSSPREWLLALRLLREVEPGGALTDSDQGHCIATLSEAVSLFHDNCRRFPEALSTTTSLGGEAVVELLLRGECALALADLVGDLFMADIPLSSPMDELWVAIGKFLQFVTAPHKPRSAHEAASEEAASDAAPLEVRKAGLVLDLRSSVCRVVANACFGRSHVGDAVTRTELLGVLLGQTKIEHEVMRPITREWALLAARNACMASEEARAFVQALQPRGIDDPEQLRSLGLRASVEASGGVTVSVDPAVKASPPS
jgi:hypothetical protein